jgi:hypothetical protein
LLSKIDFYFKKNKTYLSRKIKISKKRINGAMHVKKTDLNLTIDKKKLVAAIYLNQQ